jgi:hypothetical protein
MGVTKMRAGNTVLAMEEIERLGRAHGRRGTFAKECGGRVPIEQSDYSISIMVVKRLLISDLFGIR